ncbi:hypothetical protein TrLO_g2833 [Triparma laevis f. longispina]|uniref:Uncharacterized protein n=1 Tax=Triparma laevis f. longispina TaxID=1714387 RepID=A0A9W7CCY4_9STRA|nr:hypothetical protein TrLO_g2833 [Triparma laevis f. longispina]
MPCNGLEANAQARALTVFKLSFSLVPALHSLNCIGCSTTMHWFGLDPETGGYGQQMKILDYLVVDVEVMEWDCRKRR